MKEPRNETFIAAELARAVPGLYSCRCAALATELCAIGRRYRRLAERLCGGEEEWGRYPEAGKRQERAQRALAKLEERARELVKPWRRNVSIDTGNLCLKCCTKPRASYGERTVML